VSLVQGKVFHLLSQYSPQGPLLVVPYNVKSLLFQLLGFTYSAVTFRINGRAHAPIGDTDEVGDRLDGAT